MVDLVLVRRPTVRPATDPGLSLACVVGRAVAVTFALVILLVATSTPAVADSMTWEGGTFDVTTGTESDFASGPVPSGQVFLQVYIEAMSLSPGADYNQNAYRIHVSCHEIVGGGTREFTHSWRLYYPTASGGPGSAFGSSLDLQGCDSVTLKHYNYGQSGVVGTITVKVYFHGSGITAPAVSNRAALFAMTHGAPLIDGFVLGDPVHSLTGSFLYSRADVVIPGRGPTPGFVRSYTSGDTNDGLLGPGWTHNYAICLCKPTGDTTGALLLVGPQGRHDRYEYDSGVGSYTPPQGVTTRLTRKPTSPSRRPTRTTRPGSSTRAAS